ncbi:DUF4835 family protein [Aliifodinibius sp. S!AR15-10]|uniref:type IX secretion system protein PorD n=1 Tax=Aliifodinibius sp. S!AR15-10 TaxID=2950437 RepID=UPI002856E415|nr:DUF4835 family protein [Aliifodinibius sp. S!AR15-10]MDR8393516.1 DUF4835 family protein [Aliifodinibius sp. S!AR15-10]
MKISGFFKAFFFKSGIILLTLFALGSTAFAQEFDVEVTVDQSQVSSASLSYMDGFANEIESYFNEHDWINDNFMEHEQIQAELQIVLLSVDDNYNFQANIVLRAQRPIYDTMQQTTIFLFNDDNWGFQYTPNRAFVHDELQFDAITTLMDFYAYVMLGYDYDTFSETGGTPYFSEAQNILSLAQTTASPGWSRSSSTRRGRAQLIADLLNPTYSDLRQAMYVYHRLGLDQFISNTEQAQKQVLSALEMIRDAQRQATNDFLFDIFFNAKYREIVSIFEDAPTEVRLEAYELLSQMDQSHLSEYDKLQ